jgi:hypothetical protein
VWDHDAEESRKKHEREMAAKNAKKPGARR